MAWHAATEGGPPLTLDKLANAPGVCAVLRSPGWRRFEPQSCSVRTLICALQKLCGSSGVLGECYSPKRQNKVQDFFPGQALLHTPSSFPSSALLLLHVLVPGFGHRVPHAPPEPRFNWVVVRSQLTQLSRWPPFQLYASEIQILRSGRQPTNQVQTLWEAGAVFMKMGIFPPTETTGSPQIRKWIRENTERSPKAFTNTSPASLRS